MSVGMGCAQVLQHNTALVSLDVSHNDLFHHTPIAVPPQSDVFQALAANRGLRTLRLRAVGLAAVPNPELRAIVRVHFPTHVPHSKKTRRVQFRFCST